MSHKNKVGTFPMNFELGLWVQEENIFHPVDCLSWFGACLFDNINFEGLKNERKMCLV